MAGNKTTMIARNPNAGNVQNSTNHGNIFKAFYSALFNKTP